MLTGKSYKKLNIGILADSHYCSCLHYQLKLVLLIIKFYNRVQMIKLLKQMFKVIHQKLNRKWMVTSVDKFYDKM